MSDDKFVDAYDNLMAHLYEIMDDTLHSVADSLEIAKKKTLEGLSQEEIDDIASFLMRDVLLPHKQILIQKQQFTG